MGQIIVKQTRSTIGTPANLVKVIKGLGLRHVGHVKVHKDNNCIRGMVNKVKHLVSYELKS